MWNSLAHSFKKQGDERMGWSYDEEKTLTVRRGAATSGPLHAEVRREPIFGFSRQRTRITVRLRIDVDKDDLQWLAADEGLSLYEGDGLFGPEQGWKFIHAWKNQDDDRLTDVFLEN